jgi:hypothetical protein
MGLAGKTEGMHGDLAPVMWKQGIADRLKVLEYVSQDTRTTLDVFNYIDENSYLRWITKKGQPSQVYLSRFMKVRECMDLPVVDQSWMSTPIPKDVWSK